MEIWRSSDKNNLHSFCKTLI